MTLKYFDEVYYEELIENINSNYKYYLSDNIWIEEVFNGTKCYLESNIFYDIPELGDDESENAIKVYEALSDLTPTQASSNLLWTYLTHVDFYHYMRTRWNISGENITKESASKIKERYFCKSTRRGLFRNGISRLWWATYLTIDYTNKDKYIFTKLLFSDEDLFIGLMEREYSMCKNIVLGVLKAINIFKEKNNRLPSRECRRALFMYLNQCGAICLLDSLDESYITNITLEFIISYINSNNLH